MKCPVCNEEMFGMSETPYYGDCMPQTPDGGKTWCSYGYTMTQHPHLEWEAMWQFTLKPHLKEIIHSDATLQQRGGYVISYPLGYPNVNTPQQNNLPTLRIILGDGTEFTEQDIEAWSKGDFSSIGLDRRYPKIIRELASMVLECARDGSAPTSQP